MGEILQVLTGVAIVVIFFFFFDRMVDKVIGYIKKHSGIIRTEERESSGRDSRQKP